VTAHQLVDGDRLPLPVGSTLDPSGTFVWQPGPAFLGIYGFEFAVPSCAGGETIVPVEIAVTGGR
jgi:hypothetical protein